jgi:hypothetical protein
MSTQTPITDPQYHAAKLLTSSAIALAQARNARLDYGMGLPTMSLDMLLGDVRLVLRLTSGLYTALVMVGDTHVLETHPFSARWRMRSGTTRLP